MTDLNQRLSCCRGVGASWLPALLVAGCTWWIPGKGPTDTGDTGDGGGGSGGGESGGEPDSGQGDSDTSDTDPGGGGGELTISGVDPWWGISDGGLLVTLTGSGFSSNTEVSFGDVAATIVTRGSTELVVESPSFDGVPEELGVETVDVHVKDGGEARTLPYGFTYYLSGVDKAGAIGSLEWIHWTASAKAGLSGGSALDDYGVASLYFITPPRDIHWWDLWSSAVDECTGSDYDFTDSFGDVYLLDMGPSSVSLVPDVGAETTLEFDSSYGGYFNTADLTSAQVPEDMLFTLADVAAGFAPEDFSVADAARSAAAFELTSPVIESSSLPLVSQSSLTFTWDAGEADDRVLLNLVMMNSSGTTLDEIWCVAADDGSFTVPELAWSDTWTRASFMWIQAGRAVESSGILPYNQGETRIAGIYWNIGIGYYP